MLKRSGSDVVFLCIRVACTQLKMWGSANNERGKLTDQDRDSLF